MEERPSPLAPPLTMGTVSASLAAVLVQVGRGAAHQAPTDPSAVIVTMAAWCGAVLGAWLAVVCVLHLASLLPGHLGAWGARLAGLITPRLLRHLLTVTVGTTSVAVALPGAAVAAAAAPAVPTGGSTVETGPPPDPRMAPSTTTGTAPSSQPPAPTWSATPSPTPRTVGTAETTAPPSPGWRPSRPRPVRQASLDVLGSRTADEEDRTYVVRRGDCLWDVVRRHLGDRATDAAVAAQVPAWHSANRAAIGPDPDLIQPGTTLRPPPEEQA